MLSRRRLKRNLKRMFLPLENALIWTAGPLALGLYWIAHLMAHTVRTTASLLTLWR